MMTLVVIASNLPLTPIVPVRGMNCDVNGDNRIEQECALTNCGQTDLPSSAHAYGSHQL